jgi:pimeloyl-ACP methyl ester carboxylesterase
MAMLPGQESPGDESTHSTRVGLLEVPGATLHYETRGAGPVLLLIAGGPGDAAAYKGIAELLSDRYTVVSYDPRGNSRSTLDRPAQDQTIEIHADDAHLLLAAVGTDPAYVFGNSGGAVIGLDLVARYPGQVRTLVAHEPPVVEMLPVNARHRAFTRDVLDTYRKDGVGAAMQKFLAGSGLGANAREQASARQNDPSPEDLEASTRVAGNVEFFLAHNFRAMTGYLPDVVKLQAASSRIAMAGGEASGTQLAYKSGAALAKRLGTVVLVFPGDHAGFSTYPSAFAERLHKVLIGAS